MFDKKLKTKLSKNIFENLNEILKNKDVKDINFLITISILLKYNKIKLKDYIKPIKKSIKFLEKNFDEVYLLYYSLEHNRKVFHYNENKLLLDSLYFLTEKLNNSDYIKESAKINDVLSKIELGIERYFTHENIIVDKFSSSEDLFEIKNPLIEFENKLKDKKYFKYIEYFPQKIYDEKTIDLINIKKSIFSSENLKLKEFSKEKITLENTNSLYILILILNIIESEK